MVPLAQTGIDVRRRRLGRIARAAWWTAVLAGALVVACEVFLAISPSTMLSSDKLAVYRADAVMGPGWLAALWLITLPPAALFVASMANAACLFRHLRRGDIFHPALPRRLVWMGGLSIAAAIAEIVSSTAAGALVSASRPQREVVVGLAVESHDLAFVVLGLLLLAVALIMREALLIEEDNRSIV